MDDEDIDRMDLRFVCNGELAGCSLPGNGSQLQLPIDLRWMREEHNIRLVFSLNEGTSLLHPSAQAAFGNEGITQVVMKAEDHGAPSLDDMIAFVQRVKEQADSGEGVSCVHCNAGQGRTGTMLCAYQLFRGLSLEEAIAHAGKRRAYSPTNRQRDALLAFARTLHTPDGTTQ